MSTHIIFGSNADIISECGCIMCYMYSFRIRFFRRSSVFFVLVNFDVVKFLICSYNNVFLVNFEFCKD